MGIKEITNMTRLHLLIHDKKQTNLKTDNYLRGHEIMSMHLEFKWRSVQLRPVSCRVRCMNNKFIYILWNTGEGKELGKFITERT